MNDFVACEHRGRAYHQSHPSTLVMPNGSLVAASDMALVAALAIAVLAVWSS